MSKDALYLGIDLGGTNIQCGLVDGKKVTHRDDTKTKSDQGAEAVVDRIAKVARSVMDEAGVKKGDVAGVGIGAPGTIDFTKGVVSVAVNLGWKNYPLAKELQKRLDLPVTLDNDVNVGAWGEYRAGASKGFDSSLAIFVGTGIGGGLILDGKLFSGHHMSAGEIGHTVVRADAPLGQRTLENVASRTSIVARLTQLIRTGHASIIPGLVDGDLGKVRSKVLAQAVKEKDPLTLEVVRNAAHYVGVSIASAVTLLSLPCVVVGGGVTEALGDTWMDLIRESFEQHVFPKNLMKVKILPSELFDDAGVVGAALLARDRLG